MDGEYQFFCVTCFYHMCTKIAPLRYITHLVLSYSELQFVVLKTSK